MYQLTLDLRAAGYREASPFGGPNHLIREPRETDAQWLRRMTTLYGHCGQ
jgi:hypothetical protein